ncbi:heterokaryon incompatibility protein-domain-containing protein [Hypoxylon sp. FL1857]|nr:heterokaryon incompatibility protein-domain-containing protein [Hypoxylon sp. FL1857]
MVLENTPPSNAETMLCSTCQGIFTRSQYPLVADTIDDYTDEKIAHHPNQESFRQAVVDGCYICTAVNADEPYILSDKEAARLDMSPENNWGSIFCMDYGHNNDTGGFHVAYKLLVCIEYYLEETLKVARKYSRFFLILADGRMSDFHVPTNDSLVQIRKWMTTCCEQHQRGCVKSRNYQWSRPSRLIDVGPPGQHFITLELDERITELNAPYITMSHRWLTPQPPVLKRDNIESMRRDGISLLALPQSFQDAVSITRHMGIRYLWIDSFCILQDSEEDFHTEAEHMGHIYAGGVFNIVASDSDTWKTGLFPSRINKDLVPIVYPSWVEMDGYQALAIRKYSSDASDSPPSKSLAFGRGWIHQEIHLAPSNLFCTKNQFWWTCLEGSYCEAYSSDLNAIFPDLDATLNQLGFIRTLIVPGTEPPSRFRYQSVWLPQGEDQSIAARRFMYMWLKLVEKYSGATTKPDDKLVAIGGIVELCRKWMRQTQPSLEIGYYSGVWQLDLLEQLDWSIDRKYGEQIFHHRWKGTYTIPTWSWASVNGSAFWRCL